MNYLVVSIVFFSQCELVTLDQMKKMEWAYHLYPVLSHPTSSVEPLKTVPAISNIHTYRCQGFNLHIRHQLVSTQISSYTSVVFFDRLLLNERVQGVI